MKRYRIFITGNIHRYGFRHLVARLAEQNDIRGFAQYLGLSILIEAEGLPGHLEPFIAWCKKGPEGCTIQSFQMIEIPCAQSDSFEILPVEIINIEKLLLKNDAHSPIPENKEISFKV
ncbi:MAG: acylphosphatase [Lentimicrobium sp.]|nr:acylphosphatase [Lentimicrobium sp.]